MATPPEQQSTKSDPDTLISQARGSISRQSLTGERTGLFSKQYLSSDTVYKRLHTDEAVHYLLTNPSQGVVIQEMATSEAKTITPDTDYYALAAVTDQRIFFLIGGEDDDTFVEIPGPDIAEVQLENSFFTTNLIIETDTKKYTFRVKKRESSDPGDTVAYIQSDLIPITETEQTETTTTNSSTVETRQTPESTSDNSDETGRESDEKGLSESSDSRDQTIEAVFVSDPNVISSTTRETLYDASIAIRDADPSNDDLYDVISTLEDAKEDLQSIAREPGVATQKVEEAIDRLTPTLDQLTKILTAHVEARRKLVLAKNGMPIPKKTLRDLHETVTDAITTAEERIGGPTG